MGLYERTGPHHTCRGFGDGMQAKETRRNTGNPSGDRDGDQLAARESQARPFGVAERPVRPMKPGNAGRGKGPQLKGKRKKQPQRGIENDSSNPRKCSEVADGVARQSEGIAQLSVLRTVRQGVSQGRSGLSYECCNAMAERQESTTRLSRTLRHTESNDGWTNWRESRKTELINYPQCATGRRKWQQCWFSTTPSFIPITCKPAPKFARKSARVARPIR